MESTSGNEVTTANADARLDRIYDRVHGLDLHASTRTPGEILLNRHLQMQSLL
jgi:hypothetical protein